MGQVLALKLGGKLVASGTSRVVPLRAPQAGGSRGFFAPPPYPRASSFHTILRVRFGGHLPSSPLF
jgi:hypothetical protein